MGSVRPKNVLLLLGMMYFCSVETSRDGGCEACALHRHHLFPGVYQCMGCCFSRAFPTPPATLRTMVRPKPITSQASCCVASSYEEVELTVKNHTSCHCGTCKYHKISSG
ncbi:hypothetical protein NQD34_016547 [Periophthalmus magnuspinnatus]|uniref:glycoprotein hormones alpha chain-like n=1 Tax=Periophthalmus magnuspinnatus TaxID=409849 RepID=UPI0022C9BC12|nr:glycoprotein hormones alpha chain-like [Periophthalmus magnuspinnatus]KAJ0009132.1 hypothetical protein NQD34_016547 [Periophthalmus magnuspinnatus]